MYGYDVDKRRGVKIHKGTFISAFPKVYTNEQLDRLDEDGVVKPGTQVNKGDPLILAIGPRVLSAEDAKLGRLHKVLRRMHNDESQVWPYEQPGIVTDVALTARGAKVNVKSEGPVQKGDKVVNLHSSKGIVGEILGDDEMPRDPRTNEPYEVMFNPMTVLSRIAPNQLVEMNLGKVAKLTGKPYILPQEAPEEGWAEFARRELEKHGVDEKADVYDPKTGKTVKSLGDGYTYVLPFHHLAEKKLCVTLDTEFETTDGWVKGSDIRPRHKFRTVNPRTGEESFQFPSAINFYNMDGQAMYHVEDEHADLLVTATHRVVVDASSVPFRIELAEQLHHLNRRGLL
jgi:DNA-directed RNA polymerase beta subunit